MLRFDAETVKLPCEPVTSFDAGVAHIADITIQERKRLGVFG